jgi:A1 cistron-splicing factor AAR2
MSVSAAEARKLGSVLLVDAPKEMQFGIDNQFWTTGPLFKGVKLIPLGTHFVYYALKDEEFAARMGFFITIESPTKQDQYSNIVVRKWDSEM